MDTKKNLDAISILPEQCFDMSDLAFDLPTSPVTSLTIQDLARACRIFMEAAYPEGIDTIPANKRPYYDIDLHRSVNDYLLPAAIAAGVCQSLPPQNNGLQGHELRLGSAKYPHMKLRIQAVEFRSRTVWVYSVNTHDGFQQVTRYLSAVEAEAWRCLVEHNRNLKSQIENAFKAAKLLTPMHILELGLHTEEESS
jgi:hypothetical protein